ncbi:unnamed protein product [Blepharisma stoltei]|uniref:Uncharacterized protein n=1 Tax=Blepharisma stoltei TaxID=1481888 RepID=A0AAU9IGR9_9CILI|nr:unnamed protein product [Blepharisma stoltei]
MKLKSEPKKSFQRIVQIRRTLRKNKEKLLNSLEAHKTPGTQKNTKKARSIKKENNSQETPLNQVDSNVYNQESSNIKPIFRVCPVTILYSDSSGIISTDKLEVSNIKIEAETDFTVKKTEEIKNEAHEILLEKDIYPNSLKVSPSPYELKNKDNECNMYSSSESGFEFEPLPLCF